MEDKTRHFPPYLFPLKKVGGITIATFDPDTETGWPELSESFTTHSITRPFIFSDPAYQIEPLFQLVCKKHAIPAIAGPVKNLPLTRLILETVSPDILISQVDLATTLLKELIEKNEEISFRVLFLFDYDAKADIALLTQYVPDTTILYTKHPLL